MVQGPYLHPEESQGSLSVQRALDTECVQAFSGQNEAFQNLLPKELATSPREILEEHRLWASAVQKGWRANLTQHLLVLIATLEKKLQGGNSLAAQWLGLHTLTAEGPGSVPARGTKIPQSASEAKKQKKKKEKKKYKETG